MAVTDKITEFRKTIQLGEILRRISYISQPDLILFFDEYPIFEIRKAILRRWLDSPLEVFSHQMDWVEARILDLEKEEGETHSGFWKELLSWYIFDIEKSESAKQRAINFALELARKKSFYRSDILKIIAGELDRSPQTYWNIEESSSELPLTSSPLKLFLESFLVQEYESRWPIIDIEIINVRRVVRCAIQVEDWSFLPLIEKVLYKLSNQERPRKYDFKEEIEYRESLAFLKEAVRLFREKFA